MPDQNGVVELSSQMKAISDALVAHVMAMQEKLTQARLAHQAFIDTCATQLGVDPLSHMYDVATSRFVPKKVENERSAG